MKSRLFSCLALMAILIPAVWGVTAPHEGKWLFSTVGPTGESALLILQIEGKQEKPQVRVLFHRTVPNQKIEIPKPEIVDLRLQDQGVTFSVKQGASVMPFTGKWAKDGKTILGSYGPDLRPQRAVLRPTEKDLLETQDLLVRKPAEAYLKAGTLQNKSLILNLQAQREKDLEKKKEIQEKINQAKKEAEENLPELWRTAVAAHKDSPAGYDSALSLLRGGSRNKVSADEADKLVAILEEQANPYGSRFVRSTRLQVAEVLANDKSLAKVAAVVAEKVAKELTAADSADYQAQVLNTLKAALANAGETGKVKEIAARIAKLDEKQDAEYAKNVPPFKPDAYKGRENKESNRVAVMELFTGAQCPPCVAADVAFGALEEAYKPKDLILIQYHLHIPGPDPLTNQASIDRMEYYKKVHPGQVRSSTPTTLFNGSPKAGGGGGMANSKNKFDQYSEIINPILETKTPVEISGKATRSGNKISAKVEVSGADPKDELKVRFVVIEEKIKYVGGNKLRFHHHVVRATPETTGPVAGNKTTHSAQLDLSKLHQDLTEYLDGYAKIRAFPNPARPLDFQGLKVIALVQKDKTGEIVQAAQFEVRDGTN